MFLGEEVLVELLGVKAGKFKSYFISDIYMRTLLKSLK